MLILLFFPNDRLVWAARMPPTPIAGLLDRIRAGAWTFPPAWRRRLERYFDLPDPLCLRARAQGRLLIVTPLGPLKRKTVPVVDGHLRDLLARVEKTGRAAEPRLRRKYSGKRKKKDGAGD